MTKTTCLKKVYRRKMIIVVCFWWWWREEEVVIFKWTQKPRLFRLCLEKYPLLLITLCFGAKIVTRDSWVRFFAVLKVTPKKVSFLATQFKYLKNSQQKNCFLLARSCFLYEAIAPKSRTMCDKSATKIIKCSKIRLFQWFARDACLFTDLGSIRS